MRYAAIGLMSGTSLDGIDAALLWTDGGGDITMGPNLFTPYDPGLRDAVRQVLGQSAASEQLIADLTDANAAAVEALFNKARLSAKDIDVVGFHGQTICHRPDAGLTVQLGDATRLATRLKVDVVGDFRSADMAAGGQGAPFVPLYHAALAENLSAGGASGASIAVVNIGGVSNVTWIGAPAGDGAAPALLAFDTGPGNALLDDWVAAHTGQKFDKDGRLAAAGQVDVARLNKFMEHDFFAKPAPKSLDRDDFADVELKGLSAADGAATLTAFTASAIAASVPHLPTVPARWLVTGGGRHNRTMMAALRQALRVPIDPVEVVGWDGDALEAQAFAWLAVRSLRGLPLSIPATTGCRAPTPGGTLVRAA